MWRYLWIFLVIFLACKSGKQDRMSESEALQLSKELNSKDYRISLIWARPQLTHELAQFYSTNMLPANSQSGQVNILESTNFIEKQGDSIALYLPYFGTRQMSVNPGDTNGAIRFNGIPKDYSADYDPKRNRHIVTYSFRQGAEQFNLSMQYYKDRQVQINVNGSHRTTISYKGELQWQE